MSATGTIKNTVQRDTALRNRGQEYWADEVRLMRELMENREVVEGVNSALSTRINMQTIMADAENYAQHVVGPLQTGPGMNGAI